MTTKQLVFESSHSLVDPEFWSELSKRKLTEYRLDASSRRIYATYETGGAHIELSSRVRVNGDSFLEPTKSLVNSRYANIAPGLLRNTNTLDEFKELDKKKFLRDSCVEIVRAICSREWINNPSVLSTFSLLSFADLKSHLFYYWFAFPAIVPLSPILQSDSILNVKDVFSGEDQLDALVKSYLLYQT